MAAWRAAVRAASATRSWVTPALTAARTISSTRTTAGSDSAEKEASKQRAEETRRQRARRMSYQEKQDFLHIEDEIAALEARIAEIEIEYAASASDFQRLTALDKEREEVETKLLERMERWEFLTELQAEIESEKESKV